MAKSKSCMNMNASTADVNESSGNGARPQIPHRVYSEEEAFLHMTRRRPDREQLLYSIVDEVLFNVWDALCLSIDLKSREAYLPYLPHAFDLLNNTENGLELYDYLVFVEETQMGTFTGDALARRRASMVVDVLLGYRKSIFADN